MTKPLKLFKFHSDTNFANFVESLDFLVPGNYWEANYQKRTLKFDHDHENLDEAKRRAEDLGATIFE